MSKAPTPRELGLWSAQFDWNDSTPVKCCLCETVGTTAYIQPIHPYWEAITPEYAEARKVIGGTDTLYRCCHGPCAEAVEATRRQRRKAQLAEETRCEVHAGRRATFTLAGRHLCGRCKAHVIKTVSGQILQSGLGGLALFGDIGQGRMIAHEIEKLAEVTK